MKELIKKIKEQKLLSLIILGGLCIAFVVAISIFIHTWNELSYDVFQPAADDVYMVYIDEMSHGTRDIYNESPPAIGYLLKELYPEVENSVWTKLQTEVLIETVDNKCFTESVFWSGPEFVDIFKLDILQGNRDLFLKNPDDVYLSLSMSKKIFGEVPAVGQNLNFGGKTYHVTGIFKDYPTNSHFRLDIMAPMVNYMGKIDADTWDFYNFPTYVKLKQGTDPKLLETSIQPLVKNYLAPWIKSKFNMDYIEDANNGIKLCLIPLQNIHLFGSHIEGLENESSITTIYVNLGIVILVLFLAYFNYLNFTISFNQKQTKNITIKKYLGISKTILVGSFVRESFLYTFLAVIISSILVITVLPFNPLLSYNELFHNAISWSYPAILFSAFILVLAFAAGLLPGMVYLKANSFQNPGRKPGLLNVKVLNKGMITFQFAISIVLIIGILLFLKQMQFISNYNVGIDTENTLVIKRGNRIQQNFTSFKEELEKSPFIKTVSKSDTYPFNWISWESIYKPSTNETFPCPVLKFDENGKDVLGLQFVEGRWFTKEEIVNEDGLIINESAKHNFNIQSIDNEILAFNSNRDKKQKIVGVVRDFNFKSLHSKIGPIYFRPPRDYEWSYISIKGQNCSRNELINLVEKQWKANNNELFFDYVFMDDKINSLYEKEKELQSQLSIFGIVAIIISCLGILGLAIRTGFERTKEIGVRKVNGAKTMEIIRLLNYGLVKWVIIAFVLACPVAWFAMEKWLENFAYKTALSWWVFGAAGILTFFIALLTISWQSWRAASRNPVEALRYE